MKDGIGFMTRSYRGEIHDGFYNNDTLNSSLKTTQTICQLGNTSVDVRYMLTIIFISKATVLLGTK